MVTGIKILYKMFNLMPVISILFMTCDTTQNKIPVNFSHVLNLTDTLVIERDTTAYIWIYADYPDYQHVKAPGEGIACVDDVGRFIEVLEIATLEYNRTDFVPLIRYLTEFILYMEKDGLWYNFIYEDGSINKKHINSKLSFNFWAVRAMRGLAAAYRVQKKYAPESHQIKQIKEVIRRAEKNFTVKGLNKENVKFFVINEAPDMTSELLLALIKLHQTGDFNYYPEIVKMAGGLIENQIIDNTSELNGMYFCWENIWHSWGNNQALALLKSYEITKDDRILSSVKIWADHFIEFVINNHFPAEIKLKEKQNYRIEIFPQIAYGITSMYRGMQKFYEIADEEKYKMRAEELFGWYRGENIAGVVMYDPETGRCYDGIDKNGINENSGAESTIECLLAILDKGEF